MSRLLAIDLGGTNLRAARIADAGCPAPEPLLHGAAPGGLSAFRETLATLVRTERPEAIGIAVPGLVEGTTCRWVPNLPWLDGVDLRTLAPGARVAAGNDAQLAMLAEAAAGAARGAGTAILLAIGTGIGSGLLAGGRVVRGGATSLGWACADTAAPGDRVHGWLETQSSGRALDVAAHGIGLPDGPALVAAARAGQPAARQALGPPARALGTALAGAVALTGAELVVVSGGVSRALDLLAPPLLDRLRAHLPPHLRGVTLVPGAFGPEASLVGAALAVARHPIWESSP